MYISVTIEDFETPSFSGRYSQPTPYSNISDQDVENYKSKNKRKLVDLEDYLKFEDNTLDAKAIESHLFPKTKNDIFLSHAHGDENDVIKLAILLEQKGLKVFVDSCVWGNAFGLLKEIDDVYCQNTNKNSAKYNYDKRNYSTANVYMILNTALHRMIENSELLLFLGTENSTKQLTFEQLIKNEKGLSSPWIYSELTFAQQVERIDRRPELEKDRFSEILAEDHQPSMEHAGVKIHYPLPKTDYKLGNQEFIDWIKQRVPNSSFSPKTKDEIKIEYLENFYKHIHRNGEVLIKKKRITPRNKLSRY